MKAASLLNDADGDDESDGDEEGATSHDGDLTPEHIALSKVFLHINRYAQIRNNFLKVDFIPVLFLHFSHEPFAPLIDFRTRTLMEDI